MPRQLCEIDADIERLRMERIDAVSHSDPLERIKNRLNDHGVPFADIAEAHHSGESTLVFRIKNGETNKTRLGDLSTFTGWVWDIYGYGIHAMWINEGKDLILHLRRYLLIPVYGNRD